MIATLFLLSLWLSSQVLARRMAPSAPSQRVSLVGRLGEVSLLAPEQLRFRGRTVLKPTDWEKAGSKFKDPWDQALAAILAADRGDLVRARTLAVGAPESVVKALRCAYEGAALLAPEERLQVRGGLSSTYAGRLLESRLLEREGGDGASLRAEALEALARRVTTLALLGLALALAGFGGLLFALRLLFIRPQPVPRWAGWEVPGRTLALIFLAWYSMLLLSGTVAGLVIFPLPPAWKIVGLPLSYGIHAAFGIYLLKGFSGADLSSWKRRLFTQSWGGTLGWAAGFLGVAVLSVFLVGLLVSPLLRHAEPAQKELLETLAAARSVPATLLIFGTVAVLAPAFEELFFRGLLLPWMAARWGKLWALLGSSLVFGLIHLAPSGLPTLSTLGVVLGLAYFRTGNLRVCILVHGAWNGSVFLFTRWVLG